ncbi:SDR family NAD(P)-dependent oxidoreductase [Pseudomonas chlororaphis]|uniref:SDR family NAD(P)-dependent oxidoreductase n=2 Tax=Pseudomonas chlororaphis TaxID=587753 RepID=UPI0004719AE2|nr:SDR family oxidoreductase [Pseudomonas chlororaphis]
MGRLAGKVALITGGAGEGGLAVSELFAYEGAKVAILDLPKSQGEAVAERIIAAGGTACFFPTDVSVAEQVNRAVALTEERFGAVRVLVNHADIISVGHFHETSERERDRLVNINVKRMFLVTRAVLPKMIKAGGGGIVYTSSISPAGGTPMEALYRATQLACQSFARGVAEKYRDKNIRSNAVCPGYIGSFHGQPEWALLRRFGIDALDEGIASMPGRLCDPEEVAAAALFLASDDATFVTGTQLFMDNVYTAI